MSMHNTLKVLIVLSSRRYFRISLESINSYFSKKNND